jgi:hypothetical protein
MTIGHASMLHAYIIRTRSQTDVQLVGMAKLSILCDHEIHQVDQLLITRGLQALRKPINHVYVHHKAMINGKMYFSSGYKKVKKRNSFTVMFSTDSTVGYGIIEKFIQVSTNVCPLAVIKTLTTQIAGPPHHLSDSVITADSQQLLFNDYLTFDEGTVTYIFAAEIIHKCFNLTTDNWKVLTLPVNDIENE